MNIAICDEEETIRFAIRNLIEKQNIDCQITEFSSDKELVQIWEYGIGEFPDLLFLGITKGIDGIGIAKRLRDWMEERQKAVWGSLPLLIFVTAYTEYMAEAFAVHAFQYVLYPFQETLLESVLAQAVREYHNLKPMKQAEPKELLVRNKTILRKVPTDDIYYVESSNRKVILYLFKEKIEYYDKIGVLERELYPGFFRIHKGYLVNMKYVERYDRTELRMKNGKSLLISKYKYQEFVKAYLDYMAKEL